MAAKKRKNTTLCRTLSHYWMHLSRLEVKGAMKRVPKYLWRRNSAFLNMIPANQNLMMTVEKCAQ